MNNFQTVKDAISATIDVVQGKNLHLDKIEIIYGVSGENIGDSDDLYHLYLTVQLRLTDKINHIPLWLSVDFSTYSEHVESLTDYGRGDYGLINDLSDITFINDELSELFEEIHDDFVDNLYDLGNSIHEVDDHNQLCETINNLTIVSEWC